MPELSNLSCVRVSHFGDRGGGILYLALGHANRPFDKPFPHLPDQPDYRGPWDMAVFRTLVNRGIEWAAHRRPF